MRHEPKPRRKHMEAKEITLVAKDGTQSDRGELLYTLLDFLRLRTKYDRVCWNLKPVVLAHEILVRRGREAAARVWRKALSERIHDEADQYLAKLSDLRRIG